jgi:transcriptional regulator GlxA family with amidase domain
MTYFSKLTERPLKIVGFLGFDGMTTVDLTGPLEAFAAARDENENRCYETVLIGVTNKTFVAQSGAVFKALHTLKTAPQLDTVVIPGGSGLRQSETSRAIAAWLRECASTTRRIASVSSGIYPLAESGLLDGRRVTTHWRVAQNVASTFRGLSVSDTGSFIKDDKFYTCGGGTAGIEMSLALIQEDHGARTALRLARELVVSLRPSGGDEQQMQPAPEQASVEERLAELPAWITSRLRANLSVEVLAERACVCPRHFRRIFKRRFNATPAEFVERLRVTEAARRLASYNSSIDEVADSVGYKTADVFRRAFERRFGIAPKRFQRQSREPQPVKGRRHIRRRYQKLPKAA